MTVEKLCLRSPAHGVEPQKDVLQQLCGIQLPLPAVKPFIFRLNQPVQFRKGRIIFGSQHLKIRLIRKTAPGIEALDHNLNHVNLPVREVLIRAEKVF